MAGLLPPERDFGVLDTPLRSIFVLVGGFVLILLAFALIERIGFRGGFVSVGVIAAALALGAFVALLSHGRRAVDYYVGERRVAGPFGGLAAASAFAGILAVGLIGGAYETRLEFLASAIGLAFGFLLLAALGAPALRRLGVYTAGDFLARRFGGVWVRLTGAAVAFAASFFLLLAHFKVASSLLATLTGLDPRNALLGAAALTALPALAGGMRSLTWTQAVQYFVVLLACLAPAAYLSLEGEALPGDFGLLLLGNLPAWGSEAFARFAVPALFMALAAASLPHLMARALAAPSGREAAASLDLGGAVFARPRDRGSGLLAGPFQSGRPGNRSRRRRRLPAACRLVRDAPRLHGRAGRRRRACRALLPRAGGALLRRDIHRPRCFRGN